MGQDADSFRSNPRRRVLIYGIDSNEPYELKVSSAGEITVNGPLTDTELGATDLPITLDGEEVVANLKGYRSSDASYQPLRLEKETNTLQIIAYEHHEVHSGNHFFIAGVQDLSINQVLDFTWLMPNTAKWIHWTWEIETESETAWYVYEGAVATNPLANAVTPVNNDRNSATISGTTLKYEVQANLTAANGDTDVSGATLLESGISGAGKIIGDSKRENEIIMKQNTLYCLRAVATAAGYINFRMEWYEHQNLN